MRLLKFLKLKKDKKNSRIFKGYGYNLSPSAQTSGSDILLKNIVNRKRGIKSTKVVFRKHHGLFKKIIFLILFLCVLSFLVYKTNLLNYFKITEIYVNGAAVFVNEKDVKLVVERNFLGQSIFLVDEKQILDTLQKNFLGAKNIFIEKYYPNKINVLIEERVPLAIIYNDEEETFLIDEEGYVLGIVIDGFFDLPKIKYEDEILIGSFLEKEMIPTSIEILQFADTENLKISSMSFYPKYTRLFAGRDIEVFVGYEKDMEESLKIVNALIKKSQSEEREIKKIDLRYDKVIVLYD